MEVIPICELRKSLGKCASEVRYGGKRFIVTRRKEPLMVCISPEDYKEKFHPYMGREAQTD